jgi:hypothetical protein
LQNIDESIRLFAQSFDIPFFDETGKLHLWHAEDDDIHKLNQQHSSHLTDLSSHCCIVLRRNRYFIASRIADATTTTLRDCCLFTPHIFNSNHQVSICYLFIFTFPVTQYGHLSNAHCSQSVSDAWISS